MNTGYRLRMLITDILLIGVLLFVILEGLRENQPEENSAQPVTEQVMATELE